MKNITTTKLTNKMPKDLQYSRYEYFIWRGRKMYTIFFYTNESLLSREPRVFTLQWISDIKKRTKSSPIQKKNPNISTKKLFSHDSRSINFIQFFHRELSLQSERESYRLITEPRGK